MVEEDYIMRIIKDMVRMLCKIIFGKDTVAYELPEEAEYTSTDYLYKQLQEMLAEGNINEAENLLYDELELVKVQRKEENLLIPIPDTKRLRLALDFYDKLNQMTDEQLEQADFSREEVKEGLLRVAKIYQIPKDLL